MTNSTLKYFIVFLVTMAVIKALRGTAVRIGLIDHPGGRKRHEGAIPLIGGPAMFAGFGFGALILLDSLFPYRALFAALGLLAVVGVLDDLHDLEPFKKLLAQTVAALFMTSWGLVSINQVGDLFGFGLMELWGWSLPFTVICVLGIINAINMADGVDGLAGGLSFIGVLSLGAAAVLIGQPVSAQLLFVMAAAIAGFLLFNMRFPWQDRAGVFMGDAGSMMLGLFLTWFYRADAERRRRKAFAHSRSLVPWGSHPGHGAGHDQTTDQGNQPVPSETRSSASRAPARRILADAHGQPHARFFGSAHPDRIFWLAGRRRRLGSFLFLHGGVWRLLSAVDARLEAGAAVKAVQQVLIAGI